FRSRNSLSFNPVLAIIEDKYGNLWIGTEIGLNYFNPKTEEFTHYFVEDGLPGNNIVSLILDDDDNLWVGTNNGLSRFNTSTKTFQNFTVSDGLQGAAFKKAALKSQAGQLYVGGVNCFNDFWPQHLDRGQQEPPLVFTDFQIFNKSVPISDRGDRGAILTTSLAHTKNIVLSYEESVFSFEFASLNYSAPEKRQYAYMLEGFDRDWNYIELSYAVTYTILDPGVYIFTVKTLSAHGDWSSDPISMTLTITPPFWSTWWFRSIVVFVVIGASLSVYRIRVKAIENQKAELERQVQQRTDEVVHQTEALQRMK